MKIERLAALAELVSAIAIVVTLGYLAVQTQQNTAAVQASVRQAMLQNDLALLRQLSDYPIMYTGRTGDGELSDEDLVRLHVNILSLMRSRENQYLQYLNGVIDERSWRTYQAALPSVFSTEFSRDWWTYHSDRGEFDEGFVTVVNGILASSPLSKSQSVRERLGFVRD